MTSITQTHFGEPSAQESLNKNDPTSALHFFKSQSNIADLPTTIYGGGLEYHGFGDKYQTLKALLEVIDPSKLVVVADARDVALNIPQDPEAANAAIDRFMDTYHKLTKNDPHAVVMSAESQCCVSAMTHAGPSEYFDPVTKQRAKRACSSGTPGCYWSQNDNIYQWVDFHRQRAFNQTGIPRIGENVGDVYLNAGLMAGYPEDLINLVETLDIEPQEDDQAVLSGMMHQFPDMIVLDYNQEMFGNNQWPRGLEDGCVFEKDNNVLSHRDTKTEPLIIHTPGKFYGCLDMLIEELGGVSQQRYLKDSPNGNPRILRQEGKSVSSFEEILTPSARRLSDCECECGESGRRSLFSIGRLFYRMFGITLSDAANTSVEPEGRSIVPDKKVPEVVEENYGNYGEYGNYGQYGGYGVADACAEVCSEMCTSNYGVRRRLQ